MRAQREWLDATLRLPFRQAPSKISFQSGSGLVALLGILGEELHGDSRQRLGDGGALAWRCRLARKLGRNPESGEADVAGVVHEHVRRLDILMDEAVPMDLAECGRQANSDGQEASQVERFPLVPFKNPIQGLTARVLEHEDRPPFVTSER